MLLVDVLLQHIINFNIVFEQNVELIGALMTEQSLLWCPSAPLKLLLLSRVIEPRVEELEELIAGFCFG